jgi:chromate reductase, NAD(P)H dehydrogenase (quinone)
MTDTDIKMVAISGSLRLDSYNRKALRVAERFASEAGASVEEVSLKELNVPLYDGDIEARGFPESVQKLKSVVESSDVLLIASPEYNHSISGALKNAIDWLSRGKNSLDGKTAAIFGASTGLFGTMRGQVHLRQILAALNVTMVSQPQVFIRLANEAFNSDGALQEVKLHNQLKELINKTINLSTALKNSNK